MFQLNAFREITALLDVSSATRRCGLFCCCMKFEPSLLRHKRQRSIIGAMYSKIQRELNCVHKESVNSKLHDALNHREMF